MTVYQSSFLGEEEQAEQVADFEKILDIMVDPAIEMCISTSEEKKRVRPRWDQAVYVLNCLSHLQVGPQRQILSFLLTNVVGAEYLGAIPFHTREAAESAEAD